MGGTWEGGAGANKRGSLKRRLPVVTLAILDNTTATSNPVTTNTVRIVLKNLNADLKCHIMIAPAGTPGGPVIAPNNVPVGGGQVQLTPSAIPPNSPRIFLRPVFQDPTALANQNHPLGQDIPFGWEFSTNADEVYIDVTINPVLWANTTLGGTVICAVDVEYDGEWWDTIAVNNVLTQVQLTACQSIIIGTGGG